MVPSSDWDFSGALLILGFQWCPSSDWDFSGALLRLGFQWCPPQTGISVVMMYYVSSLIKAVLTFENCFNLLLGLCEVVMTTLGSSTPAQQYSSSMCDSSPRSVTHSTVHTTIRNTSSSQMMKHKLIVLGRNETSRDMALNPIQYTFKKLTCHPN